MKNRMFVAALALNAVAGCNWDPTAVWGGKPAKRIEGEYSWESSCTSSHAVYSLELQSTMTEPVPGCVSPEESVEFVAVDESLVEVYVKAIRPGVYPMVERLSYERFTNSDLVEFECEAPQPIANLEGRATVSCRPASGKEISLHPHSSSSYWSIRMKELVLKHPDCQGRAFYLVERGYEDVSCDDDIDYYGPGQNKVKMGEFNWPMLYLKN